MKIEELNLSVRSYHCLKRAGIHTVEQLLTKRKEDLMRIHGMGILCTTEVMTAMKRMEMTEGDRIRGMNNNELAEFIRNEQCNAVSLQRVEGIPAILERLGRIHIIEEERR